MRITEPFVWDAWPDLFRGRLRVLYELTGKIPKQPRAPLPWYITGRRARLDHDVKPPGLPAHSTATSCPRTGSDDTDAPNDSD